MDQPCLLLVVGAPRGRLRVGLKRELLDAALLGSNLEALDLDNFLKPSAERPITSDGSGEPDSSHEDAVDWNRVLAEIRRPRDVSATTILINDPRAASCFPLLAMAERVAFCSASEDRTFRNMILSRVNLRTYEITLWPHHVRRTFRLFDHLAATPLIAARLAIFDEDVAGDSPSAADMQSVIGWLISLNGTAASAKERDAARARVLVAVRARSVRNLQQVRRDLTMAFEREACFFAQETLLALAGPKEMAIQALGKLSSQLAATASMSPEERSRWSSVLCSRAVGGNAVGSQIIRWTCNYMKELELQGSNVILGLDVVLGASGLSPASASERYFGEETCILAPVSTAFESILYFGQLHFLRHRMWDSCLDDTLELCRLVLTHPHWLLRGLGTRMLAQLMDADRSKYGPSLACHAAKHETSFAVLAAKAMIGILAPLRSVVEGCNNLREGDEIEGLWRGRWHAASVVWHLQSRGEVQVNWSECASSPDTWLRLTHVRRPGLPGGFDFVERLCSGGIADLSCLRRLLDRSPQHCGDLRREYVDGLVRMHHDLVLCGAMAASADLAGSLTSILRFGRSELTKPIVRGVHLLDDLAASVRELADRNVLVSLNLASTLFTNLAWVWGRRLKDTAKSALHGSASMPSGVESALDSDNTLHAIEDSCQKPSVIVQSTSQELNAGWRHRFIELALEDPAEPVCSLVDARIQAQDLKSRCSELESRLLVAEAALEEQGRRLHALVNERQTLQAQVAELAFENEALSRKLDAATEKGRSGDSGRFCSEFKSVGGPQRETQLDPVEAIAHLDGHDLTPLDAKAFIEQLRFQRDSVVALRSSLCGALRHLGEDLYASPLHFVEELVQNADDCRYNVDVVPTLCMRVSRGHVIFSHNEVGVAPRDVSSLCSLAVSTKQRGVDLGHKGVGFKSVFACSHRPTVVSGPFRFSFQVPGLDELAFITPHWEDAAPHELLASDGLCASSGTHLFLPFRPELLEDQSYLAKLTSVLDPLVLLSLRRLRRLEIRSVDYGGDGGCSPRGLKARVASVELSTAESLELADLKVTSWTASLRDNDTECRFFVFSSEFLVPQSSSLARTSVLFAFPETLGQTLPVCAGLPIHDVGFTFLLNADWDLTTSREAVRVGAAWNLHLRSAASKLLVALAAHPNVKGHLIDLLNKKDTIFMPFWREFAAEVAELLRNSLVGILALTPTCEPRLPHPLVMELIDVAALQRCAGVTVVEDPSLIALLESCGILQVSAWDVLKCFEDDPGLFHEDDDVLWWETLFTLFVESANQVAFCERAKLAPIFSKVVASSRRTKRVAISLGSVAFVDAPLTSWRPEVVFVSYSSSIERTFLLSSKVARAWSAEQCAITLLALHLQQRREMATPFTMDVLWSDLGFLKSVPWTQLASTSSARLGVTPGCVVLVPTVSGLVVPAAKAEISSVISVRIPERTRTGMLDRVAWPYGGSDAVIDDPADAVSWERFLLQLGCKAPDVVWQDQVPLGPSPQVLPPLGSLGDVALALEVLAAQSARTLQWLQTKVCAIAKSGRLVPLCGLLGDVALLAVASIPKIVEVLHVPVGTETLADAVGVRLHPTSDVCLLALQSLSEQATRDVSPYLELLARLQAESSLHRGLPSPAPDLAIYLPTAMDGQGACVKIKDIFVLASAQSADGDAATRFALSKLCLYLRAACVDASENTQFLPFSDVLLDLGARRWPSVLDCVLAIHIASIDSANFIRLGPIGGQLQQRELLNEDGHLTMMSLFRLLDLALSLESTTSLASAANDLCLDASLVQEAMCCFAGEQARPVSSSCELPLMTWDERLVHEGGSALWSCRSPWLLEAAVSADLPIGFVHTELASNCPSLIAALGLQNLESRSVIRWAHRSNNPEQELQELSDVFREACGDPSLLVMSCAWITLQLVFNLTQAITPPDLLTHVFESEFTVVVPLRSQPPFAVIDSHVVLALKFVDDAAARAALTAAALACLLERRYAFGRSSAEAVARAAVEKRSSFASLRFWEGAQVSEHAVPAALLVLPTSTQELQGLRGLVGTFGGIERYEDDCDDSNAHGRCSSRRWGSSVRVVSIDRQYDESVFKVLAGNLISANRHNDYVPRLGGGRTASTLDVSTLKEQQRRVGERAEHLYNHYLACLFGSGYQPTRDWLSSTRCIFYPDARSGIDDGAGCDFVVHDTLQYFVKGGKQSARCFIEVKGMSGPFDGVIHLTANEKMKRDEVASRRNGGDAYIVAVVDNLGDLTNCSVRHFDWGSDLGLFNLQPEAFVATVRTEPMRTGVLSVERTPKDVVARETHAQSSRHRAAAIASHSWSCNLWNATLWSESQWDARYGEWPSTGFHLETASQEWADWSSWTGSRCHLQADEARQWSHHVQ